MAKPFGSKNLPRGFTAEYSGWCKECHIRYQTGDFIIGRSTGGYSHENCFKGESYNKSIYSTPGDPKSTFLRYERIYIKPTSDVIQSIDSAFQSRSSDVTETHAEGFEIPEPQPTPERQPEPETNPPSHAGKVITDLAGLLLEPIEARLAQIETQSKESFQQALKALAEQTGKLDESRVRELINECGVTRIEVKSNESTEYKDLGLQHELFEELLDLCSTRLPDGHRVNVYLAGPAGSGKTQAAQNVFKALSLPFYFSGAICEPFSLLGFKDAQGTYQRTAFREAYENGGGFLQDEIDGSEAVALLPFNAALANGHCAFPDRIVERHKDFVCIAAANTWGHGAKDAYVGRNKLDGASLDRYIKLPWFVDEKLERAIAGNDKWVSHVQRIRKNVEAKGIKILVTPRASIFGATLLARGKAWERVEALVLRNGMTDEQWDSVKVKV